MTKENGLQFNPIVLNGERDKDVIHDLLCPSSEQLAKRDEIINSINEEMHIHKNGLKFTISGVDISESED